MTRRHPISVRLGSRGRIVVPVGLRRDLGLGEGAELVIRSDGRSLILEPRSEILRRLRRRFANVDMSLADELLDDRRDEAGR